MKKTKRTLGAMLALVLAIGLSAAACAARQPTATDKSAPTKSEAKDRIVVKGKIAEMRSAGYYVQGEEPASEFIIVNPNVKQLKSLMKKGNTVKIEGYTTIGADRLFVEKIDGKKYQGDTKSAVQ
jgi:hypothetical protein